MGRAAAPTCLNMACGSLLVDSGVRVRGAWRHFAGALQLRGLFGAAPSIAVATLLINSLSQKGAPFAALEGRSMIVGAFGSAAYSRTVCVLLKKFLLSSWTATMAALIVWFAVVLGVSAGLFQLS